MTTRYRLPPCDLAIIGSGFSGSLLAMIGRRLGLSVLLIERGKHPRIVIGESSTPLTNLYLEEISDRYDLPSVRPLSKWGTWQRTYPEIACGLKRGFTFYHHDLERLLHPDDVILSEGCAAAESEGSAFHPNRTKHLFADRDTQLLVAASPHDDIADTHWYRADFDHFLVQEAQKLGVDYLDETDLNAFTESGKGVTLEGTCRNQNLSISAKFLVDASGPRGFLHRALALRELGLPGFPQTQALYSHFTGVRRLQNLNPMPDGESPAYPVDDAAVHHVFDGGWIWVLQFNNGITSAGVAATDIFARKHLSVDGADSWQRLLRRIPALESQFASAQPIRPFARIPRLAFRSGQVVGTRWALLPSAAGFVDPLLSTGFPLTLLGIKRLAQIFEGDWDSPRLASSLAHYAADTDADLLATARLIGALYANMNKFPVFVSLSLLYFAAVSYSEAARRLGKPHLASSFLLRDHPDFGPACHRLLERAQRLHTRHDSNALCEEILHAIEPFNVAAFGDPGRRNWYPIDPDDLLRSASKLHAKESEIATLLQRCGFQLHGN
ncbi:MAG: tryptophan 7-halogenase [Silvibacterium sp.]|nr:tryptophan 7-halogenase [Silvibacterium sp.]